jgi:hypothetical protein
MLNELFHGHELATILWTFAALFGFMGLPILIVGALMWAEKK